MHLSPLSGTPGTRSLVGSRCRLLPSLLPRRTSGGSRADHGHQHRASSYHRKKAKRLTPGESDRLLRTARIFGLAVDLFGGDRQAARQWLRTPKRALGEATPLGYAATEVGAREVEDLIGRAKHGVFS
ncbi:MAG: antitoxin Xre/MbcA/ParS toxin-binding domain-containing protein [Candidatus Rokuibacteriota bacterium]